MNLIGKILEELYCEFRGKSNDGSLANYIPELTRVNPGNFGMVITTVDGHQYAYGDTDTNFTIQSVSKPFVYGMAIQEHGVETVLGKISVEPSGEAFNSISVYPDSGRPLNPMINAGAIAATSLVWEVYKEKTFEQILDTFSIYAGSDLTMDESVYYSENATGHRNRAIAHLLRNFNILESEVEAPLNAYFQQCSINVNCRQLSVMGATMANNGLNPISGKRALNAEYVPKVLSVMCTCGMYDYSGEWVFNVGLPAKSGVGGGVLAVLPGQLSIAVYSPLLDAKGNSVLGVDICKKIADVFSLHLYKTPRLNQQVVRRHLTMETIRSKIKRDKIAEEILQRGGVNTHFMELQGELSFATIELFMRKIPDTCETLILDLYKCNSSDEAAINLLLNLDNCFRESGKSLLIVNYRHLELFSFLDHETIPCLFFDQLEEALLHCENLILQGNGYHLKEEPVPLVDQQLLGQLTQEELQELEKYLIHQTFKKGEKIIERGTNAENIYFLESGWVSIIGITEERRDFNLALLTAGNSFGEMALLDKKTRSADVKAETDVSCFLMQFDLLDQIENLKTVKAKILTNLAAALSERLRVANQKIAGFV